MGTNAQQTVETYLHATGADQYVAAMKRVAEQSAITGRELARLQGVANRMRVSASLSRGRAGGSALATRGSGMGAAGAGAGGSMAGAMRAEATAAATATSNVSMLGGAWRMLAGAAAAYMGVGTLRSIVSINSEFENTQRLVAGLFTALGQAGSFTDGLVLAERTVEQINAAAAMLPGEAQDYIDVFKMSLPNVSNAIGGTIEQMTAFTNQWTAVTQSMGVAAPEAALGLNKMLAMGRATIEGDNVAFRTMLPFISKVTEGTRNHVTDAKSFNKLSQSTRAEILKQTLAMDGLRKMIENAGDSWDAQAGATKSIFQLMARQATAPLFQAMKDGLKQVNALFMDSEGHLTEFGKDAVTVGKMISTHIVGALEKVGEALAARGQQLADLAMQHAPGGSMQNAGRATIASAGGQLLETTFSALDQAMRPAIVFFTALQSLGDELMQGALPGIMLGLEAVIGPLGEFAAVVFTIASEIIEYLRPSLQSLFNAVGHLAEGLGKFLGPVVRGISMALMGLWELLKAYVMPVITAVVDAFTMLVDGLGSFLGWLGELMGAAINERVGEVVGGTTTAGGVGLDLASEFARLRASADADHQRAVTEQLGTRAPGTGRGPSVNNDFRGSRFNISNKFAEGYDPDRIAIAFAGQLSGVATRRTSSNMAPRLGTR